MSRLETSNLAMVDRINVNTLVLDDVVVGPQHGRDSCPSRLLQHIRGDGAHAAHADEADVEFGVVVGGCHFVSAPRLSINLFRVVVMMRVDCGIIKVYDCDCRLEDSVLLQTNENEPQAAPRPEEKGRGSTDAKRCGWHDTRLSGKGRRLSTRL
ncbi:hypothetical protein HRR85_006736 [Exophiala dermatitidis]|nr:hypothetical protein HRR85_006736 [Exophiala dermatitidis]